MLCWFHFGSQGSQGGGHERTSFSLPETPLPTFWRPRRHHEAHRDPKAPKMDPQDFPNCTKMTSKPPKTGPKSVPDPKNRATALPKQIENRESKEFDYKQSYLHYVLSGYFDFPSSLPQHPCIFEFAWTEQTCKPNDQRLKAKCRILMFRHGGGFARSANG